MAHYFSENNNTLKSNPQVIAFSVNNTPLKFHTDNGVFSKNGLDRGTSILLKYLEVDPSVSSILDLGCGYGVVGIYLNIAFKVEVDMVDINLRAIELSMKNIELNHANANVFQSDGFEKIKKKYDLIVTNPPIRAGKEIIYKFYEDAAKYLNENGCFYVVINKKHGADSTFTKLQEIYRKVALVDREKGFHVYRCEI
jgi:16S rRNA (guanine1207-N2)-methyltransferase